MFNNIWHPKESPVRGITGLWGGLSSSLTSGGGGGALYDFTDATFTGVTRSQNGPSLSEARTLCTGTSASNFKNNTSFFNVSSGFIVWTVPEDATYRFKLAGGRCGPNYDYDFDVTQDATGAIMQADFVLTSGTYLCMVIASEGDPGFGNVNTGSCAGGGSFIWDTSAQSAPYTGGIGGSTLLLAAGGAGSSTPNNGVTAGPNKGTTATSAPTPNPNSGPKGTPGSNGTGGTNAGSSGYDGGAGAGWTSNCTDDICGKRYAGGSDTSQSTPMHGGWGGGGGAHDNVRQDNVPGVGYIPWAHGRAGGGGYSGGCGSHYDHSGAGGASFCATSAVVGTVEAISTPLFTSAVP